MKTFSTIQTIIILCSFTIITNVKASKSQHNQINIKGTPSFVTVGLDATCDYPIGIITLQNAINLGASEIRVTNDTIYEPINIISSVNIIGGFNSCQDAVDNIPGTDYSIINGVSSLPVIDINNSDINISNFLLRDGNVGIRAVGGGAVFNLTNLLIQNNNATGGNLGGGLSLTNVSNAFLENVLIKNNSSVSAAGGVYCNNGKFTMVGESSIDGNSALSNIGGGIYADDCHVTLVGGRNSGTSFGVINNQSDLTGGGIHFTSSAGSPHSLIITGGLLEIDNIVYGDLSTPFKIQTNGSSSEGGGIYSFRSNVNLTNIEASNNFAQTNGGFLRLQNNSTLNLQRSQEPCWTPSSCNSLYLNNANTGGVFNVTDSNVNISSTTIAGNRSNFGTVLVANGQNSSTIIDITTSFIFKNGTPGSGPYSDNTLMHFANNAKFNLLHSTIVDNATINKGIEFNNSGDSTLTNSIIYSADIGPFIDVLGTSVVTSDCLIVDNTNNTSSGSITAISPTEYDNTFLDPANFDYHLRANSIAIDHCSESALPVIFDIDGDTFGYDEPNLNGTGSFTYDVGADEHVFFIFTDGFE